jgi:hypothetical protein
VKYSSIIGSYQANPGSTVNLSLAFRFLEDPLPGQEERKTSIRIPEAKRKVTLRWSSNNKHTIDLLFDEAPQTPSSTSIPMLPQSPVTSTTSLNLQHRVSLNLFKRSPLLRPRCINDQASGATPATLLLPAMIPLWRTLLPRLLQPLNTHTGRDRSTLPLMALTQTPCP